MAALLCTLATELLEDAHPITVAGQNGRLSIPQRRRIGTQLSLVARRLSAISELLVAGSDTRPTVLERPTRGQRPNEKTLEGQE
jgi:hypothetical protein